MDNLNSKSVSQPNKMNRQDMLVMLKSIRRSSTTSTQPISQSITTATELSNTATGLLDSGFTMDSMERCIRKVLDEKIAELTATLAARFAKLEETIDQQNNIIKVCKSKSLHWKQGTYKPRLPQHKAIESLFKILFEKKSLRQIGGSIRATTSSSSG